MGSTKFDIRGNGVPCHVSFKNLKEILISPSARNSYGSYGKTGSSPSTASAIAKALQGASVRVFGVLVSNTHRKGPSPQQIYNPYPAYPTTNAGLIGDARPIMKIKGFGASSTDGFALSPGMTAEKLMYECSRYESYRAINELANEDLHGCELSYTTAIRMLEAVLENDEELIPRKRSSSLREDKRNMKVGISTDRKENWKDDGMDEWCLIETYESIREWIDGWMDGWMKGTGHSLSPLSGALRDLLWDYLV
ncbi:hypothetical protein EYC84_004506 [Monilinia fructicola]|uniref:ATG1-like MIT domain-containing protein n=1 Tax=Monilinia fructicola TaxID=38448 RepID=A0A5M9K0M2_MONFR|nr:hypothetical protein EYC84_004506 [Monilinia fructicola]